MQRDNLINARRMRQQNNIPHSYNQNQRSTQQFQNQNQINSQNQTNNQVKFNIEQQLPSNSFQTTPIIDDEFQNDIFYDANEIDENMVQLESDFNMNHKCYESYDANYGSDNFYVSNNMNNYDVRHNNFYDDNWKYNNGYFGEFENENSPDYNYTNNNTDIYNELFHLE